MVKMFINQIGMTMFGTMLALATTSNPTMLVLSSVFAVLFYLFLTYSMSWELGAKDKQKIDGGRMKPFPAKGLLISVGANVPNLLLALLMGIGAIVNMATEMEWAGNMSVICNAIARLLNGMYLGMITTLEKSVYGGASIVDEWWWFIIITIPAMLTSWGSYVMGTKELRISAMLGIKQKPDKMD
ncbi:MAG: hypothetical protein IJ493_09950 [Clostridia bacterium]|nr:hypothetical protein [Clostridia bacterium]